MRTIGVVIKVIYRIFKWVFTLYALWQGLLASRWIVTVIALIRLLRGRPQRDVRKMADFQIVHAGEPAIYERRGWRKLGIRRRVR